MLLIEDNHNMHELTVAILNVIQVGQLAVLLYTCISPGQQLAARQFRVSIHPYVHIVTARVQQLWAIS